MKILYYSPHPHLQFEDQTGYGTHMREMIAAFGKLGHEVQIFIGGRRETAPGDAVTPRQSTSSIKSLMKTFTPSLIWETFKDVQLIVIDRNHERQLRRLVDEFNPDIIYERSHYGMVSGVKVASDLGIHHILEVNSPNVDERIKLSGKSLLTRRAARMDLWAFSQTDHVLTVSSHLAEHLEINRIAKRWSVTPNAIRPGQHKESNLQISRKDLGIDESAILLGFVGSIFPWHGVDFIIDAVAHLQQLGRHVQAMIVGDGAIREELESFTQSQQLDGQIHFIGSLPHRDTFAYTELCDILIMPKSNAYGSPVKIFEYALSRKPCIVPHTSPVLEVFEHGTDGWVVDSSLDAIVSAIESIIDSPQEAEKCADNWHNNVTKNHTWQANANVALSTLP